MRKLFYKRDAVVFLVLIILVLACAAALWIYRTVGDSRIAVIEHNSIEIKRINLDKVAQSDIIFIDDDDDCYVEIEVQNGRICVRYSSCPDKVCVNCGWLYQRGDAAVCLPNSVIVRIE